jgi:hypothetical protein
MDDIRFGANFFSKLTQHVFLEFNPPDLHSEDAPMPTEDCLLDTPRSYVFVVMKMRLFYAIFKAVFHPILSEIAALCTAQCANDSEISRRISQMRSELMPFVFESAVVLCFRRWHSSQISRGAS